jgi:hypothetical protein
MQCNFLYLLRMLSIKENADINLQPTREIIVPPSKILVDQNFFPQGGMIHKYFHIQVISNHCQSCPLNEDFTGRFLMQFKWPQMDFPCKRYVSLKFGKNCENVK